MIIPVSWIPYVDMAVLILVAIFLVIGLYKGFLLMAIEFFSLIVTFLVSYFISPALASKFNLAAYLPIDVGIPSLNQLILERVNELIWFLIVFAILMVIFAMLRSVINVVTELPLIREINVILGGLLGVLKSYLLLLLVIFVLTSPFIKNGNIVLNQTVLGRIHQYSAHIFTWFKEPTEFNRILQDIMNNKTIREADLEKFIDWLKTNVTEKEASRVIEQIHIEGDK